MFTAINRIGNAWVEAMVAMEAMASLGGQRGGLMMLTENRINTTIQRLAVEGINNNTTEVKNKPFIPLLNLTQLQWIKAD